MSLYADYIAEARGDQILENEFGFATYRLINEGKTIYLIDLYIVPEYRRKKMAFEFAREVESIGKELGCKDMWTTMMASAKDNMVSLNMIMNYGMKLHSSSNDVLVFKKDLV